MSNFGLAGDTSLRCSTKRAIALFSSMFFLQFDQVTQCAVLYLDLAVLNLPEPFLFTPVERKEEEMALGTRTTMKCDVVYLNRNDVSRKRPCQRFRSNSEILYIFFLVKKKCN